MQPHLPNGAVRRDLFIQHVLQLGGSGAHVGERVELVEELEVAPGDRARQRVPTKRVAVVQRLLGEIGSEERVEHALAGDGRGLGQVAAGQALAQAQQVGAEPALLRCEQRAGASEPRRHLVADE